MYCSLTIELFNEKLLKVVKNYGHSPYILNFRSNSIHHQNNIQNSLLISKHKNYIIKNLLILIIYANAYFIFSFAINN